jgi:hypothetical protein
MLHHLHALKRHNHRKRQIADKQRTMKGGTSKRSAGCKSLAVMVRTYSLGVDRAWRLLAAVSETSWQTFSSTTCWPELPQQDVEPQYVRGAASQACRVHNHTTGSVLMCIYRRSSFWVQHTARGVCLSGPWRRCGIFRGASVGGGCCVPGCVLMVLVMGILSTI